MNDDSAKPRYHSPLRSRQKEQTRDLILNAVDAILRRAPVSEVTIAAVARQAEVTERTIYRHFPAREDLLNASWRRALRAFTGGQNTAITDATGTASSVEFTANNTVGGYTVTASLGALSTNFSMTNHAGPPASITVTGGSPQSAWSRWREER